MTYFAWDLAATAASKGLIQYPKIIIYLCATFTYAQLI